MTQAPTAIVPQKIPLVTSRPARTRSEMDAAFADFLRLDVANGDASPDTITGYRGVVESWVNWCLEQGIDPATVTMHHIKHYRQTLIERNLSPVTVRWNLMVVRRFYEAARNAGLRLDNPVAGVKGPRVRHAAEDFKYLSEADLATLLAAVPDPAEATGRERLRRLRDLLMIGMMALQGLRTIEVARASVEDLTEKGEHLTLLVRGKTKDRIAYLRPDTAERLREYLALRGLVAPDELGTPLFTNAAKRPHRLGRSQVRLRTAHYLRQAGLKRPGISNHALRHTAGTLGYLHTGDLRAVQDFLGHADPRMTARYAHVVDMAKRNPALFIPVKVGEYFAPRFRLPPGHFCPTLKSVRGNEFVRRIQALGKRRGVEVRRVAHRGKGSHGLLYYGSKMTTVRDLKDEVDKRAYHKMLKQLGLSEEDVA